LGNIQNKQNKNQIDRPPAAGAAMFAKEQGNPIAVRKAWLAHPNTAS
jgi:hypothetical protein